MDNQAEPEYEVSTDTSTNHAGPAKETNAHLNTPEPNPLLKSVNLAPAFQETLKSSATPRGISAEPQLSFRFSKHLDEQGYKDDMRYTDTVRDFLHHGRQPYTGPRISPEHHDTVAMGTGALIFRWKPNPKILLIKRATTDSVPDRWETPGGGVDDDGKETILEGLVREVKEETGLTVSNVVDTVGHSRIMREAAVFSGRKENECIVLRSRADGGTEEEWMRQVLPEEAERELGQYFRVANGRKVLKISFLVDVEEVPYEPQEEDKEDEVDNVVVTLDPKEHSAYAWVSEEDMLAGKYEITYAEQRDDILRGFQMAKKRQGRWKDSVWGLVSFGDQHLKWSINYHSNKTFCAESVKTTLWFLPPPLPPGEHAESSRKQ